MVNSSFPTFHFTPLSKPSAEGFGRASLSALISSSSSSLLLPPISIPYFTCFFPNYTPWTYSFQNPLTDVEHAHDTLSRLLHLQLLCRWYRPTTNGQKCQLLCVHSMAMTQDPIDWRYLPYIRPMFQAYVREYPHKIWPEIWY